MDLGHIVTFTATHVLNPELKKNEHVLLIGSTVLSRSDEHGLTHVQHIKLYCSRHETIFEHSTPYCGVAAHSDVSRTASYTRSVHQFYETPPVSVLHTEQLC